MKASIIVFCLLFGVAFAENQCSTTNLQLFTHYSLGQQNQLNKTFQKIQIKVPYLNNVTYVVNETATFKIVNIKPLFYYFDAKQKVEVTEQNTIVVYDGRVDVRMPFQWSRVGPFGSISGTGQAFTISDGIAMQKNIIDDNKKIEYNLVRYDNITFTQEEVILARISPPNTTKEDIDTITKMFKENVDHKTVKQVLEEDISEFFGNYLNQTLHEQRQNQTTNYSYNWVDPIRTKGSLLINYTIPNITFHVEKQAFEYHYTARNTEDSKWHCTQGIHFLPYKVKDYGSQEFLSFDIYNNTLRYAAEKGFFNTNLNKDNWESRMFQFYAGDLFEVIPQIAEFTLATEKINGLCKTRSDEINLVRGSINTLNVTFNLDCDINNEKRGKITGFQLNLTMEVEGKARKQKLDFYIINSEFTIQYLNSPYKVQNEELANLMVKHSLNRLKEDPVFGSGWRLWGKDYPHFMVGEKFTVVYDSTHINPSADLEVE